MYVIDQKDWPACDESAEALDLYLRERYKLPEDVAPKLTDFVVATSVRLDSLEAVFPDVKRHCTECRDGLTLAAVREKVRGIREACRSSNRAVSQFEIHECEDNANPVWRARLLTPEELA